jgi:hypothetical protein
MSMSGTTKKAALPYLEPWLRYREAILDFWTGLTSVGIRSPAKAKPAILPSAPSEKSRDETDHRIVSAYLYQYDEFMKYWHFQDGSAKRGGPVRADEPPEAGHGGDGEGPYSETKPSDLLNEYLQSLVRGADKYLALWQSASDFLILAPTATPEERPLFPPMMFSEYWLRTINRLMMPWTWTQAPATASGDPVFSIPGNMRLWMDILGSTSTNTWISLLKKDIDYLVYETGRIRETLKQLQSQNLISRNGESALNEVVALQRNSVAQTAVLAGELKALKTAVNDLKSSLRKQKQMAYHSLKNEKSRPRPHA